jgi:ABC-type branched-subunit amino acid transport system permease subunit
LEGLFFDFLKFYFSAPQVQAAAFGLILVLVVMWAPMRWLRKAR